jgi:P-type conjugative transfer protein TrbJ
MAPSRVRRWGIRLLGLLLALGPVRPGHTQFAVEDVYVGIQTSIAAINTARALVQQSIQIANEVEMIKNQIEMLAYAAANLTKSPLQLLGNLMALIGRYEAILRQAEGIGFDLDQINERFGTLYGLFGQPITDVQVALGQLSHLTHEVRRASLTAFQAQAIRDRLQAQQFHLQMALTASEQSAGALAVAQNTNQILGIMVDQQASMQQIYAASERLKAAMGIAEAAASDHARQIAAQATATWGHMEEVQGVGIPEFR